MKLKPIFLALALLAATSAFADDKTTQSTESDINTMPNASQLINNISKKLHSVKPYSPGDPKNGMIIYALPKLDIYVDITATCTINIPGPFAQYAERYLASTNAVMHRSHTWKFQKADIIDEVSVDTTKFYLVNKEYNRICFVKNQPIILSVGDWILPMPQTTEEKASAVDSLFHTELLGEETLTSTSIPKMAERAAKQIFQLREARMALLSCDVAHQPDGIATREILNRIDSVERELTALFIGKRVTVTRHRSFAIDPTKKQSNLIIARLSTIEGIKEADEMIGIPIYADVNPTILTEPTMTKKEQKAKKGYFYNVPGSVTINVRQGTDYTLSKSLYVPQNGYATWLQQRVRQILFTRIGAIQMIK